MNQIQLLTITITILVYLKMSQREQSEKQEDFEIAVNQHKRTKLNKFLSTIDSNTINAIQQYLKSHKQPQKNDNKWIKIKLYHDLLIILTFKRAQHLLKERKKIDELCEDLHKIINLSVSTIKERINKKLANISAADICSHIKHDIDFSFTSKRKLVDYHLPISLKLPQPFNLGFVEPSERENDAELINESRKQEIQNRPESKIETKTETKPESSLETKTECQPECQPDSKWVPKPENRTIEENQEISTLKNIYKDCNNDFLNLGQQLSDRKITIEINGNMIAIGTIKERENTEKMCNRFESTYLKLRKLGDEKTNKQGKQQQQYSKLSQNDVSIEIGASSNQKSSKKKLKQIPDIPFDQSLTLQSYLMNPKNSHEQQYSQYYTKQFRKQSSSKIQRPSTKLSNQSSINRKSRDSEYQSRNLKESNNQQLKFDDQSNNKTNYSVADDWGKQEDAFLRTAVTTNNIKDLNILLKYRKLGQVHQRIEELNMNISDLMKQYLKIP